jgi:ribosomal protein L37AE/L43A
MTNIEKAQELKSKNDYSLRSCWECNHSHEYLKNANGLFTCVDCGKWYMNGGFFDNHAHCDAEYIQLI